MKYFNCHTHTFNMHYVPDRFLSLHVPPRLAHALHWILSKSWLANPLLRLSKFFVKGTNAKMIAFLKIGLKKTQDMVFADLCSNYPENHDVKFIVLPLDFTYMGAGNLRIPYEQQLDDLFELKLRHPDKCYPFVAIDPRRGTAPANRAFVQRYINKGFSGIKLYPALGFFPFQKGLEEVYAYAQEYQVPIMTHCSSGGVNYAEKNAPDIFINPEPFHKIEGKEYCFPQKHPYLKMKDYCDQFNHPLNYEEALARFPELKICFAHFGLNASKGTDDPSWFNEVLRLMGKYKSVYADISYSVSYSKFCTWFKERYEQWDPAIQNRVLFGTDYFMTVQEVNGEDNKILEVARKELGDALFLKLANENVISYLKKKPS